MNKSLLMKRKLKMIWINLGTKKPYFDAMSSELFKFGEEEFLKVLHNLVLIWTNEVVLNTSNKIILCPIWKKGRLLDFKNYLGISPLPCIYKIFSNIFYQLLLLQVDKYLERYQYDFRQRNSNPQLITYSSYALLRNPRNHSFVGFQCKPIQGYWKL